MTRIVIIALQLLLLISFGWSTPSNSPHPTETGSHKIRYSSFTQAPKTLDPARSYSSNEIQFIAQIYEPPLQYHYLKRPYQLVPLTAAHMPIVEHLDTDMKIIHDLDKTQTNIAYTRYIITIKPGIYFQPHPAFFKNKVGLYPYHVLDNDKQDEYRSLSDFSGKSTRELTAADYVYQIKRLADPSLNSPIYGLMSRYIVGMKQLHKRLDNAVGKDKYVDLRKYKIKGVKALSRYRYSILIKGDYPQFMFWLSMPFFAPAPWEADVFYAQPNMKEYNIGWDWYPVGTGPYLMSDNDPNKQIVLQRNPSFNHEKFVGGSGSIAEMLSQNRIPMIDQAVFSLEKESIPRWNKFLQGYYDQSGVQAESFDQVVSLNHKGEAELNDRMKQKGIKLETSISPSIFYMGFNMTDPIVGGLSIKKRALRAAISIAIDYEEYISLFLNGRGLVAHGPLPPGIFGHQSGEQGMNHEVYQWQGEHASRKDIGKAKELMRLAGYPDGMNPATGKPLVLHYDVAGGAGGDDAAYFNWLRKQFGKLGVRLEIRATQYNRFQDKMRTGQAQIFSWGWHADYPDPENFLFLLYGPNGKVKSGGENAANYQNKKVDRLFEKMANMPNGKERQAVIDAIIAQVRKDAPWIFGFHPMNYKLSHHWNGLSQSHGIAYNTLKYQDVNASARRESQKKWNQAVWWPALVMLVLFCILMVGCCVFYNCQQRKMPYDKF